MFRCELRDSYVHSTVNATPGGAGYGIGFNVYAADNLVENSIAWNFNKVMLMRASGGGNVIGYSYFDDGWIEYDPTWVSPGIGGQDRLVYEERPGDNAVMPMWSIGFQSDGKQEPKTVSTLLRHGNYDFVTKDAVWDPASANHPRLPSSLYMTKAPDFMAGYDWPWVDPVTGQTKTLPAKVRFDAMPHP